MMPDASGPAGNAVAENLWREQLVAIAALLRARGVSVMSLGPEPDAATWYDASPDGPEFVERESMAMLLQALRQLWLAQGLPELAACAEPLLALADAYQADDTPARLPPSLYAMF